MTETQVAPAGMAEYVDNPFINRLPTELELVDIHADLDKPPLYSATDRQLRPGQRFHCVMRLAEYSQPTTPALQFGILLDLVIKRGYVGRDPTTTDYVRRMEHAVDLEDRVADGAKWDELGLAAASDTSLGFAAIGTPGGGKTHTVKRTCARYPQVIKHTEPFKLAQIVWLRVECPPAGSPKSLCDFFFQQVDTALRSHGVKSRYEKHYRGKTLDAMMAGMARVATLHAIGVLIVDEIQNVKRVKQDVNASVLNFLVTLRNSIGIPVVTVGTMAAQRLLQRTFHDARRGDGLGSIHFERMPSAPKDRRRFGKDFKVFVEQMWRWQWTAEHTALTDDLVQAMYHETQGVIDLVVKLFILVQLRLLQTGGIRNVKEVITPEVIRKVAKQRLRVVQPYIEALRTDDWEKLREFDDLLDFDREYKAVVVAHHASIGRLEKKTTVAGDDGGASAYPAIGEASTYDILLAAQGIPAERRDWIMSKAKELATGDDIGSTMLAMSQAIAADRELQDAATEAPPPAAAKPVPTKGKSKDFVGESADAAYGKLMASGHIGFDGDG